MCCRRVEISETGRILPSKIRRIFYSTSRQNRTHVFAITNDKVAPAYNIELRDGLKTHSNLQISRTTTTELYHQNHHRHHQLFFFYKAKFISVSKNVFGTWHHSECVGGSASWNSLYSKGGFVSLCSGYELT